MAHVRRPRSKQQPVTRSTPCLHLIFRVHADAADKVAEAALKHGGRGRRAGARGGLAAAAGRARGMRSCWSAVRDTTQPQQSHTQGGGVLLPAHAQPRVAARGQTREAGGQGGKGGAGGQHGARDRKPPFPSTGALPQPQCNTLHSDSCRGGWRWGRHGAPAAPGAPHRRAAARLHLAASPPPPLRPPASLEHPPRTPPHTPLEEVARPSIRRCIESSTQSPLAPAGRPPRPCSASSARQRSRVRAARRLGVPEAAQHGAGAAAAGPNHTHPARFPPLRIQLRRAAGAVATAAQPGTASSISTAVCCAHCAYAQCRCTHGGCRRAAGVRRAETIAGTHRARGTCRVARPPNPPAPVCPPDASLLQGYPLPQQDRRGRVL